LVEESGTVWNRQGVGIAASYFRSNAIRTQKRGIFVSDGSALGNAIWIFGTIRFGNCREYARFFGGSTGRSGKVAGRSGFFMALT
jgi:hypothetical protein